MQKPFDGADGDLLHLLPGAGQPRSEFQVPAQRPDIHGLARPALGILEIESGAEGVGAAGEHHHRGVGVVLEAARRIGELTQRFRRQRIDAVAAVEAHHGDASLGPRPFSMVTNSAKPASSLPDAGRLRQNASSV